ncbi:hypothetical protein HMPREF9137_1828 [Prevotella denticola F0289]|nr:hypothetical protein HMPREF9137_1828 [Prevotella denticola F0289]
MGFYFHLSAELRELKDSGHHLCVPGFEFTGVEGGKGAKTTGRSICRYNGRSLYLSSSCRREGQDFYCSLTK